ncbi:MAG: hypothetical protein ABIV51_05635 [Saprospiraceae bacterium]
MPQRTSFLAILFLVAFNLNAQSKNYRSKVAIAAYPSGRLAFKYERLSRDFNIVKDYKISGGVMANIEIYKRITLRTALHYGLNSYQVWLNNPFYGGYKVIVDEAELYDIKYYTKSLEMDLGFGYKFAFKRLVLIPFTSVTFPIAQQDGRYSFEGKEIGTNNTRTYSSTFSGDQRGISALFGCDNYYYFKKNIGLFYSAHLVFGSNNIKYQTEISDLLYYPSRREYDFKMNQTGVSASIGFFLFFGQSRMENRQ